MQEEPISVRKNIVFWLVFLVVSTIVLILTIEVVGHLVVYAQYGVPGKSYGLWKYDAELGAIHASNAYNSNSETNNLGFRNREDVIDPKPKGALRIIAYGGSTTFCYNLPTDEAWPIRLQNLLRLHGNPKDQVLNGGAIVWSMAHEITRAKRDLPLLHPDYVILYSGLNEETNALFAAMEGKDMAAGIAQGRPVFATNFDQNRWLKRNSVTIRFLDYGYSILSSKLLPKTNGPVIAQPDVVDVYPLVMRHFEMVLGQFIDLIKQNGATPIYVIMGGVRKPDGGILRLLQYSRNGAAVARDRGVLVIDSQEVVDGYAELGARLLAEFIQAKAFPARASGMNGSFDGGNTALAYEMH
jgi:hypothetical protein